MNARNGMEFTRDLQNVLGAAFPAEEVEYLPRSVAGSRALALPYIEARDVMRRLDDAVGPENWSFDFDLLDGGGRMVRGRLTVLGVTKCDAGEASSEDELLKSAVSDALKRCGVHFGIGRYLYYLPRIWAAYDSQKRQWTEPPRHAAAAVEKALQQCGIAPNARNRPEPRHPAEERTPVLPPAPASLHPRATREPQPAAAAAEARPLPDLTEATAPTRLPDPVGVAAAPGPAGGSARRTEAVPAARTRTAEPTPRPAQRRSMWSAGGGDPIPESAGDRAATQTGPRSSRPEAGEEEPPRTPTCTGPGCGRVLTRGQVEISSRSHGRALCPACQKQQPRSS